MVTSLVQSKSKTFLAFCFCFLLGVATFSFGTQRLSSTWVFGVFFLVLFCVPLFFHHKRVRFFLLSFLFFWSGIARVSFALPVHNAETLAFYNGQKRTFEAQIAEEPDVRTGEVRYIAQVTNFYSHTKVHGRVSIKAPLYPRYHYGDTIELTCQLQTPEPIEGFRYDKYLATFRVYSVCTRPLVTLKQSQQGNYFFTKILLAKDALAQKINTLWHEPYASFVGGILYGYRGGLGNLQNDFNRTGVTHIVAVSGFNITLIANIFASLLLSLTIPRKKAFWVTVSAIGIFVLFTGASASVVRAGLMGIIALTARQLGRPSRATNAVVFASVLMCVHNPWVLLFDAGFQLSVLSTLGLMYFSNFFATKFARVPQFLGLRESLSSTCAAILATLPLILFQFGRLSLVAPLVNILILPAIPVAMALSFGATTLGFLYLPCATIVSYLAFFVLKYVVTVVQWFSALSFASVEVQISWWTMILLYAMLLWWGMRIHKNNTSL